MIVREDEERFGHRMPGAHDHESQLPTDDAFERLPSGWAPWDGDRTVVCEDWWCADEVWSYDLFDLQDSGLVPMC